MAIDAWLSITIIAMLLYVIYHCQSQWCFYILIGMPENPKITYDTLINRDISPQNLVEALSDLAEQWLQDQREKKAIECLDYACQHLEAHAPDTALLGTLYQKLGHLWRRLGNHKLTGFYYKNALSQFKAVHQSPHYDIAACHFVLGSFLHQIVKPGPAAYHYEKAYTILDELPTDYSTEMAQINTKREQLSAHTSPS